MSISVVPLRNPVLEYPWGSRTFLAGLTGGPSPSERPQAELWMGAHPKASSMALWEGEWLPLQDVLNRDGEELLGRVAAERFCGRLPFLFKVLAAERPLSIQAHPDRIQAREGFRREEAQAIPLSAPHRNYRDAHHKPEILCALTPFTAFIGFRGPEIILSLLKRLPVPMLWDLFAHLRARPRAAGLEESFGALMRARGPQRERLIREVTERSRSLVDSDPAFQWVLRLGQDFPGDVGVLCPLLLNPVALKPGEAVFVRAGEPHAYMEGAGIELMANSDNVLRGGLTSKHVDIPGLLQILDFSERPVLRIGPQQRDESESVYPAPAEEFLLSVIRLDQGRQYAGARNRSVEILICISGKAQVTDVEAGKAFPLEKGASVLVPAALAQYRIEGRSTIYRASVPV
ncbi:MAG: mannose-6-phosphate isomerase, class I [Deltaproteobacteria bacterium]|nr:mannose-6-phosphate isomerase, class I [Deltaproteobacteria bacterium]